MEKRMASLLYGLGWVITELIREVETMHRAQGNLEREDYWTRIRWSLLDSLENFREGFRDVQTNGIPQS